MAVVTLVENMEQQVSCEAPKIGKGIEEILYFPQISQELKDDANRELQEVWVLEGKRFEAFIAETEKYDEAAQKLTDAQTSEDPAQIKEAQDHMRETLAKGFGKKKGEHITPVPQGAYKGLIECIGKVSRKVYYISNHDLKKVQNTKGNPNFRIPFGLFKNKKRDIHDWTTAILQEEFDKDPDAKRLAEKDDPLRRKFMDLKVQIQKEWKFLEKKEEGQLLTKKIKRLVTNPIVQEFLLSDETCDFIDESIKFFNNTANFSINQKEQKRKQIAGLLEKPDGQFSHYEWGLVLIGIQEIWNKTEPDFLQEIKNTFEKIPLKLKERKPLIQRLYKKELPAVCWDASGGAQMMRYSLNSGGSFKLDFAKMKVNASYAAQAKFSLLEAGAEANKYFPNNLGAAMKYNIPIRVEKLVRTPIGKSPVSAGPESISFAFDSFFVLPGTIVSTVRQLEAIKAQKESRFKKGAMVNVIGHTDKKGSRRYNLKLGKMRAQATFEVFVNNYAAWYGYLKEGKDSDWGTVEKDFMKLSIWYAKKERFYFYEHIANMQVDDGDTMEDLLKKIYRPVSRSPFPHDQLETPSLKKIRQQELHNAQKNIIKDGPSFGTISNMQFDGIPGINPLEDLFEKKLSEKLLIESYFGTVIKYALEEVQGVRSSYLDLFYFDCVSLPYLSKGEDQPVENTGEKSAANRRVELEAWGLETEYDKKKKKVDFGSTRIKVTGTVSCFVGATIGLSANVDLVTCNGVAQLVGKQKEKEEVVKYEGNKVVPGEMGAANASADAGAFAGASAQAGLAIALEWKTPKVTSLKPKPEFGVLASVGGSITGTAGASLKGEFKIGFDRQTGTFQIKMKAQAAWGLGGGGSWSFTVGVQQLWDFVTLVYDKLQEHDFNFIDIFEDEKDEDGDETESKINVYEVYTSWVVEQYKQGHVLQATGMAIGGLVTIKAFELLSDYQDILDKWKEHSENKEELETMIRQINTRPGLTPYLPPEAKGRMLFLLVRYKEISLIDDLKNRDMFSKSENAAVKLITDGISSPRDWQETMEHMAIKQGDRYVGYAKELKKTNELAADKAHRAKNNVIYLRNELLDEPEDWNTVERHLSSLGVGNDFLKNK